MDSCRKKTDIARPADLALPLSVVMSYYLKQKFRLPIDCGRNGTLLLRKGDNGVIKALRDSFRLFINYQIMVFTWGLICFCKILNFCFVYR